MNSVIPKDVLKRAYFNIKYRCENPENYKFHLYGGRGITFKFKDRETFNNYVCSLPGWFKGAHIDRIDNEKGYEEGNLRWVTNVVNTNNRRRTLVTKKGLAQGVSYHANDKRVKRFAARIHWNGENKQKRSKCLGIYMTEEEAHEAFVFGHIMLHGESVFKLCDYIKG